MNEYDWSKKLELIKRICEEIYSEEENFVYTDIAVEDNFRKKEYADLDISTPDSFSLNELDIDKKALFFADEDEEKKLVDLLEEIKISAMEEVSYNLSNKGVFIMVADKDGNILYKFTKEFLERLKTISISDLFDEFNNNEIRVINMFIISSMFEL